MEIKFLDGTTREFDSLVGANLSRANLYEAYLTGANLFEADLSEADLRGVDLRGACLFGANLTGANLAGAKLYGANLSHCKGIVTFQYSQHFAFAYKYKGELRVKIGCKGNSVKEWLENWKDIGEREEYSEIEMSYYLDFINMIFKRGI
jgi:hypothetical protein